MEVAGWILGTSVFVLFFGAAVCFVLDGNAKRKADEEKRWKETLNANPEIYEGDPL